MKKGTICNKDLVGILPSHFYKKRLPALLHTFELFYKVATDKETELKYYKELSYKRGEIINSLNETTQALLQLFPGAVDGKAEAPLLSSVLKTQRKILAKVEELRILGRTADYYTTTEPYKHLEGFKAVPRQVVNDYIRSRTATDN